MHPKVVLREEKEKFISKRWQEKENIKLEISSTYMILIWITFVLLIYYIWTINVNATIWFKIRELDRTKNVLLLEKEQLEVKLAQLDSLDNFSEEDYSNMEKVDNPDYLVIKEWINYVYND